jgi:hypothetical protein
MLAFVFKFAPLPKKPQIPREILAQHYIGRRPEPRKMITEGKPTVQIKDGALAYQLATVSRADKNVAFREVVYWFR